MRPGCSAASRPRATSLASSHGPRRFVSSTASVSSSDILWARWASGMPALLTRMSTRPSASLAWATAWVIDSASVTSRAIGTHSPPLACDLLGQLLELVDAAGGGGDLGSRRGQREGEAPPEAGAGAGHEGDAAR